MTLSAHIQTYEELHRQIALLAAAKSEDSRHIIWLDELQTLGVSKGTKGLVEIFVFGPQLAPQYQVVAQNTDYKVWTTDDGSQITGNRVRLQKEAHFEAFAAFICIHLVENGVYADSAKAFAATEPAIALAYDRDKTATNALVGLIGELVLLRTMLAAAPDKGLQIVRGWQGFEKSLRDFQFGTTGIEVKTSTTLSSAHHIQGIHQVEPGHLNNDVPEVDFYLLSLGISAASGEEVGNSFSMPELLDLCISSVRGQSAEIAQNLESEIVEKAEAYLKGFGTPYKHDDDVAREKLSQRWQLSFARAYDMSDTNIRLLNSDKLAESPMVISTSVSFDIILPTQVTGDLNPIVGLQDFTYIALQSLT